MEQTARDIVKEIIARETWSIQDYTELVGQLFTMNDPARKFSPLLREMETNCPELKGAAALKIGMARYALCRFPAALEAFELATDNKDRRYLQAMCLMNLHRHAAAAEEFQRAADRGWDKIEIQSKLVEAQALAGDVETAKKSFSKFERKAGETADCFYLRGLIAEMTGDEQAIIDSYERARQIDPTHSGATFRLAYYMDLHGEEALAVELYNECLEQPPIHTNALINLAVLYEDAGEYDMAIHCLHRILVANPNHARARLFLKDAEASKTMYYDEDQAKRIARRNAVLDIPVTDFELSVRARNCLKKMNIASLGDLVNTTEPELLSYKNFGETSLKEIKGMLTAKGLHLGQALDESGELTQLVSPQAAEPVGDEGILATPIERVEFSVRARRALDGLRIATLGELVAKSEPELMGCRNFGQTSLNEVRQRLAEYGLQLREQN